MKLRLRCTYEPQLAGGDGRPRSETLPVRVHVYGTHELRRNVPSAALLFAEPAAAYPFDADVDWIGVANEQQLYAPFRKRGAYTFAEVDRLFEPHKVSRAARVVINAFVSSMNPERQRCWVRAGSASFTQANLRRALAGERLVCALVQNAVDVDMSTARGKGVLRTDAPLVKGVLTIESAQLIGGTLDDFERSLLEPQPAFDMASDDEMFKAAAEMNLVIDRVMATFFGPRALLRYPSIAPLLPFHEPVSMRDQEVLSSMAMTLQHAMRPPPAEFFTNAITIVHERRGIAKQQMLDIGRRMRDTSSAVPLLTERLAFASMVCACVTLFASSLPYIEDFANRNRANQPWREELVEGDEDNKTARAEGADDCEGVASENVWIALDLIDDGDEIIGSATPTEITYDLLRLIVWFLRLYVPCQTFGAVTNAKLAFGCASQMTRENTLAHTYGVLMPFDKFDEMLSDETRALVATTKRYRELTARRSAMARLAPLPVLLAEGTATVDGTYLPIDLYYDDSQTAERDAAIAVMQTKEKLLEQVHEKLSGTSLLAEMIAAERLDDALLSNRRDLSGFYKWVNGMKTAMFAEARVVDFALYYQYTDRPTHRTYGQRFNDFLLSCFVDTPAGRPQLRMLPTTTLTKREAAVADNILALEEVVPRLLAPSAADDGPLGTEEARRALAAIVVERRPRMPSTLMHKGRILVTTRARDVRSAEIEALQAIAQMQNWAAVSVDWRRVARVELPNLEPVDILDIVFQY